MNLDATYFKDLQIFLAVVESKGISNAQTRLNKDASTISRSISSLETRLRLILCERGRQGFKLTKEGEMLVEETIKLFSSFRTFEHHIESMGGKSGRKLSIGIIDNIITDDNCSLHQNIKEISEYYHDAIQIDLIVKNPYDLEKYLLDKRIDLAIGIFENKLNSIAYQPLYQEIDYLYCSSENPVADLLRKKADKDEILNSLKLQKFSARVFLNETDIHDAGFQVIGEISFTANIEAVAIMLLSGKFIGFLPEHYAKRYVDTGQLIPILKDSISRLSNIELAYREKEKKSRKIIYNALNIMEKS